MIRTIRHTESLASAHEIVTRIVVEKAEHDDQDVEKNEEDEEEPLATFVNHPDIEPFHPSRRPVRGRRHGAASIRPLERLETSALGLVALQVAWLKPVVSERVGHVGVLGEWGHLAVGEIEAGGAFPVVGHERGRGAVYVDVLRSGQEGVRTGLKQRTVGGSEDEGGGRQEGRDKGGHWAVGA